MGTAPYEAIVVGGGPAGLSACAELSRLGVRTLLLERKREVGIPVQCGEAVSRLFMEECGMAADLPWVVAPVRGLRMVMPNGGSITLPRQGFCIRRDAFEKWLFAEYAALGGEAHLGERVLDAAEENGRVRLRTKRGEYAALAVVAADGPLSGVATSLGLIRSARCISAIQYKFHAADARGAGILNFYFSGRIAGGYFWVFPTGGETSVGVGEPTGAC